MNETFRISEARLRKRRLSLVLVPLIALGVALYQSYKKPDDIAGSIVVVVIVVGIAIVVAYRQYKSFANAAQVHSLTLGDDALLFRDGGTERRVPYDCIEKITLRGMFNRVGAIGLNLRDIPEEVLYGYEEFPQLVNSLLKNASHATVRTRGLFMYNNAFKRDVPRGTRP